MEEVICCDYFELLGRSYGEEARALASPEDSREAAMEACDFLKNCTGVVKIRTGRFVAMESDAGTQPGRVGEDVVYPRSTCRRSRGRTCSRQVGGDEDTCIRERENLQAQYATAYEQIVDLQRDADRRVKSRPHCVEDVRANANAQLVPLAQQRERSTLRSEEASKSISSLSPVLQAVQEHLDSLRPQIEELRQECLEADEVSQHLQAVRSMILNMESCPGKNTFDLAIPIHVSQPPAA